MLRQAKVFSGFSSNDLDASEHFYSQILGVEVERSGDPMDMLTLKLSGGVNVLVYPKGEAHSAASFTVLNFEVDDIESAVDELTARGVTFEHYGGDMQTDDRGIFRGGGPLIAWFKDPAGNVLSVLQS